MSNFDDLDQSTSDKKNQDDLNVTHFGYRNVAVDEKEKLVSKVFHSVAQRYDIMNDFMSMGIHRLWKRFTIELSSVRLGDKVLDVAGGTGDLTKLFVDKVGALGQVVLTDINDSMMHVARDKLINSGIANVNYVQANAQCLPFNDNSFDVVSIAFGLRNVTHKEKALASMYRVLKPGGRLLILEFSKTENPLFSRLYEAYSFFLLPKMGKFIANDEDSYRYLAESIRKHPDQETLKTMISQVGFANVSYHNMTGGVVALHKGIKPSF